MTPLDLICSIIMLTAMPSLLVWFMTGKDPLLLIARGALWLRCGIIAAYRLAVCWWPYWREETRALYAHMRQAEGA